MGLERNNYGIALSLGDLKQLEHNCHYLTARNRMPYEDLNENLNVTASTKTTQGDAAVAGKRWYVKAA